MCKRRKSLFLFTFIIVIFISAFIMSSRSGLFVNSSSQAQTWALMPPYNVLWPLWSPPLSPVDPVTGVATPLVNAVTKNTILPVQPALVWDPTQPDPFILYNTPTPVGGGLLFFDVYYGLNTWPPAYLQDPVTGVPTPITFLSSWSLLLPTSLAHLEFLIPTANATYALTYGINGQPFLDLLTAAQIWGLPPVL
ncbi:MAG: hypothetical protein ACMUJM_14225 [bacterium]